MHPLLLLQPLRQLQRLLLRLLSLHPLLQPPKLMPLKRTELSWQKRSLMLPKAKRPQLHQLHLSRTKKSQHLLLTQQKSNLSFQDGDFFIGPDELDLQVGYRKAQIVANIDDDEELSDYVKTRLLLARLLAMKKYDEKWG
jgi:hypothetical protein